MFGRTIMPSALSVKCLEPLTQWHGIACPKTWIFIAKHCSYVWTFLRIKHVAQRFKSILLFKYAGRWKMFKYINGDSMLHHCQTSRTAFCRVKLHCCSVCHCYDWHHWCFSFFCSVLCAYWWLRLLLTSVSVIFYCMNVIIKMTRMSSSHDFTHTLEKNELLAVRTCNNWSTLSLFHVQCQESIARLWLTNVIYLINVICIHMLFCGLRVTSADCSPASGTTKYLGSSDIGHMPPLIETLVRMMQLSNVFSSL
jgi:hypothetical protein